MKVMPRPVKSNVPSGRTAELHLRSKGGDGFGLRKQNLASDQWIELFADRLDVPGLTTQ